MISFYDDAAGMIWPGDNSVHLFEDFALDTDRRKLHVCFGPIADIGRLFDQLVGAGAQRRRDGETPSCGAAAEIAHDDGRRGRQEH